MSRHLDPGAARPDGLVERGPHDTAIRQPASYAFLVPRLRRCLPTAPTDRRTAARPAGDVWRGRLIDLGR